VNLHKDASSLAYLPPELPEEETEIQQLTDDELKELKDFEELGEKQPAVPQGPPKPRPKAKQGQS
jgi:hypothetical protein